MGLEKRRRTQYLMDIKKRRRTQHLMGLKKRRWAKNPMDIKKAKLAPRCNNSNWKRLAFSKIKLSRKRTNSWEQPPTKNPTRPSEFFRTIEYPIQFINNKPTTSNRYSKW